MEQESTNSTEYVFDRREVQKMKDCVDYCYHRLYNHQSTGLHKLGYTVVDLLELKKNLADLLKD